jgi:Transposase
MAERSSSSHPTQRRYPPELRERAVRLVREVATEQGERHGAVTRVAKSLGIGSESVRLWVRLAEIDECGMPINVSYAPRPHVPRACARGGGLAPFSEVNDHEVTTSRRLPSGAAQL